MAAPLPSTAPAALEHPGDGSLVAMSDSDATAAAAAAAELATHHWAYRGIVRMLEHAPPPADAAAVLSALDASVADIASTVDARLRGHLSSMPLLAPHATHAPLTDGEVVGGGHMRQPVASASPRSAVSASDYTSGVVGPDLVSAEDAAFLLFPGAAAAGGSLYASAHDDDDDGAAPDRVRDALLSTPSRLQRHSPAVRALALSAAPSPVFGAAAGTHDDAASAHPLPLSLLSRPLPPATATVPADVVPPTPGTPPPPPPPPPAATTTAAAEWRRVVQPDGSMYYFHRGTRQTVWELPAGVAAGEVRTVRSGRTPSRSTTPSTRTAAAAPLDRDTVVSRLLRAAAPPLLPATLAPPADDDAVGLLPQPAVSPLLSPAERVAAMLEAQASRRAGATALTAADAVEYAEQPLGMCLHCHRRFAADRLETHQAACAKAMAPTMRAPFDAAARRLHDSPASSINYTARHVPPCSHCGRRFPVAEDLRLHALTCKGGGGGSGARPRTTPMQAPAPGTVTPARARSAGSSVRGTPSSRTPLTGTMARRTPVSAVRSTPIPPPLPDAPLARTLHFGDESLTSEIPVLVAKDTMAVPVLPLDATTTSSLDRSVVAQSQLRLLKARKGGAAATLRSGGGSGSTERRRTASRSPPASVAAPLPPPSQPRPATAPPAAASTRGTIYDEEIEAAIRAMGVEAVVVPPMPDVMAGGEDAVNLSTATDGSMPSPDAIASAAPVACGSCGAQFHGAAALCSHLVHCGAWRNPAAHTLAGAAAAVATVTAPAAGDAMESVLETSLAAHSAALPPATWVANADNGMWQTLAPAPLSAAAATVAMPAPPPPPHLPLHLPPTAAAPAAAAAAPPSRIPRLRPTTPAGDRTTTARTARGAPGSGSGSSAAGSSAAGGDVSAILAAVDDSAIFASPSLLLGEPGGAYLGTAPPTPPRLFVSPLRAGGDVRPAPAAPAIGSTKSAAAAAAVAAKTESGLRVTTLRCPLCNADQPRDALWTHLRVCGAPQPVAAVPSTLRPTVATLPSRPVTAPPAPAPAPVSASSTMSLPSPMQPAQSAQSVVLPPAKAAAFPLLARLHAALADAAAAAASDPAPPPPPPVVSSGSPEARRQAAVAALRARRYHPAAPPSLAAL